MEAGNSEARSPQQDMRALWRINRYLWLTLGFSFGYIPFANAEGLLCVPPWQAWVLFFAALMDGSARSLIAFRHGGKLSTPLTWTFFFFDISVIALAIRFTSGLASELWLVYFVVIIYESLYANLAQLWFIGAGIGLSYLLATFSDLRIGNHSTLHYGLILGSRLYFLILSGHLAQFISLRERERDREISLLREQMATGEERSRIAREIHDGLGHALVSCILRLELCSRLILRDPTEAETILQEEVPALRAAWNEGRDLAFHLRPWETRAGKENLISSLQRHGGRFSERTGLAVQIQVKTYSCDPSPEKAFELTRIIQEALTNIARHSHATQIEISLECTNAGIRCVLKDNGIGFQAGKEYSGIGTQVMRERAEALGGSLEIESEINAGTTITVCLP